MHVTLDTDEGDPPALIVGTPERLFEWRYYSPDGGRRFYDVSRDGQRFLMITTGPPAEAGAGRAEINIVLNWHQELKEMAPGLWAHTRPDVRLLQANYHNRSLCL